MALQETPNQSSNPHPALRSTRNAWLYWVLANAAGHVAGVSAFGIVSLFVTWGGSGDVAALLDLALPFAVLGVLDGLLLGLAQGLVVQHFTGRALLGEWALFTGLGGIAAWVLGTLVGGLTIFIVGILFYVIAGGIAGVLLGYSQRPTVQRHLDPQAGWIIPNMVAGGVAVTVAIGFSSFWGNPENTGNITGGVEVIILAVGLGGLVYGGITARSFATMLDFYAARASYGSDEPVEDITKLPVR
jgi:hypothetical protein